MSRTKRFLPSRFIRQLIPHSLRQALEPFMNVLAQSLSAIMSNQNNLRSDANYKLKHNAQIRLLRTQLNEYFTVDTFEIIDGTDVGDWTFIYPETTGIALLLTSSSPVILSEAYMIKQKDTFIVKVPSEIYNDPMSLEKTKEIINNYKLAGKTALYQPL